MAAIMFQTKVVIRLNEVCKQETWQINGRIITEAREYKYLGVNVIGGNTGGMNPMKRRLSECRKVMGMIKYTASRSGDRLVVGREAWKGVAVSKLMYGCGAIAGDLKDITGMDKMQNEMGRWLWLAGRNASNALIRGETGWSTFREREAKAKLDWMWRVIFEDGPVSKIGRATVAELGTISKWWRRVNSIAHTVGLEDLINLIALKRVNVDGLRRLGLTNDDKTWKKYIENEIKKMGTAQMEGGYGSK